MGHPQVAAEGAREPMPRYVIHIGPHKTGTTYLQASFRDLRTKLVERGIMHPAPWLGGGVSQEVLFRRLRSAPDGLEQEFGVLNSSDYKVILISSEDLSDLKEQEIAWLKRLVGECSVEIVFYCRRWSELMLSGWREMVKHGFIGTFPELFAAHVSNPFVSHVINFQIKLDKFTKAFGEESIRLVPYNYLVDNKIDLFKHFAACFLDWPDAPLSPAGRPNQSVSALDAEMIRVLRVLEWALHRDRSPDLFGSYQRKKLSLDTENVFASMEADLQAITAAEDAPGFRLLHESLFEQYGSRLVKPHLDRMLFVPKRVQLPFVGQNYLLVSGATEALNRIYTELGNRPVDVSPPNEIRSPSAPPSRGDGEADLGLEVWDPKSETATD